jgi:energy-coupling factor transporter transmembrane protein EcfT
MRNTRGNFLGRLIFLIVIVNIISTMFGYRQTFFSFSNFSPFFWFGLIFIGVVLPSIVRQTTKERKVYEKEESNVFTDEESKKLEKSEYDFDDEFAIDPKDYE